MPTPLAADRPLGRLTRRVFNVHRQGPLPSVAVMSSPRSGSTWLMELIRTQPGFKSVEEPLNLRTPQVARALGTVDWQDMIGPEAGAVLDAYFRGFLDGRLRFMDHRPFTEHHRWRTDRLVFKILHGAEYHTTILTDLGVRLVHLVRHPIPVALSRRSLPRLDAQMSPASLAHHSSSAAAVAQRIARDGSQLERGVLAWCLHNAPLLSAADITLVTYEQLVVDPSTVIHRLADDLALPEPHRMLSRVRVPSHSHASADGERLAALQRRDPTSAVDLIDTWRSRITLEEARSVMEIAAEFGIDLYRHDSGMPTSRHLLTAPETHEARTS